MGLFGFAKKTRAETEQAGDVDTVVEAYGRLLADYVELEQAFREAVYQNNIMGEAILKGGYTINAENIELVKIPEEESMKRLNLLHSDSSPEEVYRELHGEEMQGIAQLAQNIKEND